MMDTSARSYLERLQRVPGYFSTFDGAVFMALSQTQTANALDGDLLEIGAYWGRSAILLGCLARPGEQVHVNDLFEMPPPTATGRMELTQSTADMPTRTQFERTYLRFHADLPVVHQCASDALADVMSPHSFRFIHVDGSHTQEAVEHDIDLVTGLLKDGGLAVFDDYANPMHPGVAAALWPAIAEGRLIPFGATPSKLYTANTADAADWGLRELASLVSTQRLVSRQSLVSGRSLLAIKPSPPAPSAPSRYVRATRRMVRRLRARYW